jgi:hypothetical protein
MISIDRVQIVTFMLAVCGLIGLFVTGFFEIDGVGLVLGFAFGWVVDIFQTMNHMIIDGEGREGN